MKNLFYENNGTSHVFGMLNTDPNTFSPADRYLLTLMALSNNSIAMSALNKAKRVDKLLFKGLIQQVDSLTYWGQVTRMCVSKLAFVGSNNDLLEYWILWVGSLGTNFS